MKARKYDNKDPFAAFEVTKGNVKEGRINVVIPRKLHEAIGEICFQENIFMSKFTADALQHHLSDISNDDIRLENELTYTSLNVTPALKAKIREVSHYKRLTKRRVICSCLYKELLAYETCYGSIIKTIK